MARRFLKIALEPPIAVVRIDRPEKKNALSLELLRELHDAAGRLVERTDISAVILAGRDEYFSAGLNG